MIGDHFKWSSFQVRPIPQHNIFSAPHKRCEAWVTTCSTFSENLGINLWYHSTKPRNHCTSFSSLGTGKLATESTSSWSVFIPSLKSRVQETSKKFASDCIFEGSSLDLPCSNIAILFQVVKVLLLSLRIHNNVINVHKTNFSFQIL